MHITSLVYKGCVYAFLAPILVVGAGGRFCSAASAVPYAGVADSYSGVSAAVDDAGFAARAEAMVSTVEVHLQAQNYAAAAEAALEVTQLYPAYLKGWMLLGYCRSLASDFALSNEAYQKALDFGADPNVVHARRAYNLVRLGEYDEAKKCYGSILESNANDLEALKQLGYLEGKLGDYDAAASYFRRAMEAAPDDADLVVALAKVEAKRGDDENARELLERALLLEPSNMEILDKLGLTYIKDKNYRAALDPLKKLAALDPTNDKAYRNLGAAYYQLGDKKNALDAFAKVKELGGDMDDLLGPLADCCLATAKKSEALAVIQEGIGKGVQQAWLYSLWGKVLEESKDYDGAIEKFSEAVRLQEAPWSDYAKKQIARQSELKKRDEIMAGQLGE
jgi:tetratricopeptide (TPR) repeat protein